MNERQAIEEQLYIIKKAKVKALEHAMAMHRYRTDPAAWLVERFGENVRSIRWSDYPEYSKHNWDGDRDPLEKAWYSIAKRRWVGVESASGTGKTYTLARIVYWFLDVYENSLVVTSAPKKDQLQMHLWSEISRSFQKFKRIRPHAELTTLRLKVDARKNDESQGDENSWMAHGFVAGVKANEESTTKAQGFHRKDMLIITEETPGMPAPTLRAFTNTSTGENNVVLCVGNPDSVVDPLHLFITGNPGVEHVRISGVDHPNIVLNKEIIPGAITNKSIVDKENILGKNSPIFRSRVHGICPAQSTDSLIRLEWIEQCIIGSDTYEEIEDDFSSNALGVDVAQSDTGDKAALAWGKRNTLIDIHEFYCPNATHLAYNVLFDDLTLSENGWSIYGTDKIENYNIQAQNIGVDTVGVGVATFNAFNDNNYEVQSLQGGQDKEQIPLDEETGKPKYNFASLRAQMYWQLAQDLQHRQIKIAITDRSKLTLLKTELVTPKYTSKTNGILVESKEAIKKRLGNKSPNNADAMVYWNWVRVQRKDIPIDVPFSA